MNNYNNAEWQKSMKIRLDYNNMMSEFVGEKEGISEKTLLENAQFASKAYNDFLSIRGTGMTGWADLPYNQTEIVEDIIETANNIRKNYKYLCVLCGKYSNYI